MKVDPRTDLIVTNQVAYPLVHFVVRNSNNYSGTWTGKGDIDPITPTIGYSNPKGTILNLQGENTAGNSLYTDVSGSFNHAINTTISWVQLNSGRIVADLNGTSSVATVTDPNGIFSPTIFTFNSWVNMDALTGNPCLASKKNTAYDQANGWIIYWSTSDSKIALRTVGGTAVMSSVVTPTAGTWHMMTIAVSGTGVSFFFDGVAAGTATITQVVSNADNLRIGEMSNDYPSWYDGKLSDQIFITGTAITAAQSLIMYNQQLPSFQ